MDEQRMARAVIEQKLREGAAVMDATGETIGNAAGYDMQEGYLVVSGGTLFAESVRVPLSAIRDTGASGLYLSGGKDKLLREYGAASAASASGAASAAGPVTGAAAPTGAAGTLQPGGVQAAPQASAVDAAATGGSADAAGEIRVPVYEEDLVVGTRVEETGRVHLHKEVVQEQESIPVTVRHEEVTVERVPVTGPASAADLTDAFREETIEVPVMGEEAIVGKQAHVVEEVRLHKDVTQEQETVSDTVRKERVIVEGVAEGTTGTGTVRRDADRLMDR